MEPFTQTAALNEELKNPHLVETLIRVAPSTGKRIQNADLNTLDEVFRAKLSGNIPEYDVNFNVQGVPLILTKQSHVELRLTPVFNSQVQITKSYLDIPSVFEFNRALWPKVNAACITSASATFSNFGVESPAPMFLPYLRYYRMDEDLRVNNSRAWNPSYLMPTGSNYVYNNRYISSPGNGCFPQPIHRSPYEATLVQDAGANRAEYYSWYGQPLQVQIPLEDVLPVFQIPVIPLRQTNTSNINLRIRLLSPRHMFFSCCYLNPNVAASYVNGQSNAINLQTNGIQVYVEEEINLVSGSKSLQDAVLGGGTLAWLKALSSRPFCQYEDIKSFYVDFDVDCELVLHCLTTPLLNPLAQQYIEPFIDEQNQFVAHFADYYMFSQTLQLTATTSARFVFTPSQLFYNTTHIALFFIQEPPDNKVTTAVLPTDLSGPVKVGDFMSILKHGHFLLQENIDINQFQILLGSSCTPLFDRPLSLSEMLVATEDAMKKYNPNEMFGNVIGTQSRLYEGDAFFLFDLTHARNSGYFIDADNMIRVEGTVSYKKPLNQQILNATNAAPAPQTNSTTRAPVLFGVRPTPRAAAPPTLNIHVIMMLIWQNTFTVLLDLDGAVLFQQQ